MKFLSLSTSRGFTLIELLVVVLIISILAAIALPQYEIAVEKSRMTEAVTNVRILSDAAERYLLAIGSCPTDLTKLDVSVASSSKYFRYAVMTNGNNICQAYAERLPSTTKYQIYRQNRVTKCWQPVSYNASDIDKALCSQFNANNAIP